MIQLMEEIHITNKNNFVIMQAMMTKHEARMNQKMDNLRLELLAKAQSRRSRYTPSPPLLSASPASPPMKPVKPIPVRISMGEGKVPVYQFLPVSRPSSRPACS